MVWYARTKKAHSGHSFVYINTKTKGKRNKSGAKINIRITPITEPNIKPSHKTNPVIISPVTIIFHTSLNGNRIILSKDWPRLFEGEISTSFLSA